MFSSLVGRLDLPALPPALADRHADIGGLQETESALLLWIYL